MINRYGLAPLAFALFAFSIFLISIIPSPHKACLDNNIAKLEKLMRNNKCDIGTLASPIKNNNELIDSNVVKVQVDQVLKDDSFFKAKDFFREKK